MRPLTDPDWRCARCLRQRPYVRRHGIRPTCNRCNDELKAKGLKWCAGCAKPQPLAAFAVDKGRCRPCAADQQRVIGRAWAARYRERYREQRRAAERARWRRRAADPEYRKQRYRRQRLARARRLLRRMRGEQP